MGTKENEEGKRWEGEKEEGAKTENETGKMLERKERRKEWKCSMPTVLLFLSSSFLPPIRDQLKRAKPLYHSLPFKKELSTLPGKKLTGKTAILSPIQVFVVSQLAKAVPLRCVI